VVEVYLGIKWLHVLSACIAFGSNVTHIFWILAANRDPGHRANTLRLVKKIDDRMSVPCYGLAVVCGVTMWMWQWPTNSSWIIASVILTTVLAIMGICFGVFMKKWIRLAEHRPPDTVTLPVLSRRLTVWWIGITVSAVAIIFLMVRKPMLW
jgi:uncharacterized membrane protein